MKQKPNKLTTISGRATGQSLQRTVSGAPDTVLCIEILRIKTYESGLFPSLPTYIYIKADKHTEGGLGG